MGRGVDISRRGFKEQGIELVASQEFPEAEGTGRVFIATFLAYHIRE